MELLLPACRAALAALNKDAEAMGAAQTSRDISWFELGEATIMKAEAKRLLEHAISQTDPAKRRCPTTT